MPSRNAGDGETSHHDPKAAKSEETATPDVTEPTLLELARQAQKMRATVVKLFPRNVFRDSAWDMMIELFTAGQQNRVMCIKDLILVSGETSTSALRRIDRLETAGLLQRRHDSPDHRRVSVDLTAKGEEAMTAMLRSLILH